MDGYSNFFPIVPAGKTSEYGDAEGRFLIFTEKYDQLHHAF